ncbi:hypothetical protein Clacol_001342 [Clathrus columnatus]|uniref:Uncharacterized protein n=1 Tax=Clathrus columnatus TaxID=1419009 RepID=A0AAV4ZY29_9AGAM|nr:hypothetical protein Clacol_001342 [Clathrus columnatus]
MGDTLYLFYDNSVWSPKDTRFLFPIAKKVEDLRTEYKPFLFVLIDNDVSASEPKPDLVFGNHIFPIQAASPDPNHFERWAKRRKAGIWGLPLWDETELNLAFPLQPRYPEFKALLEEGMSAPLEPPEKTSIKAALNTLKKWREKKNRLLNDLRIDDDSDEEKIIEKEDEIYGINMSTIDGALEVLIHAAIQDFGPVARDVYDCIFDPEATSTIQANAIANVTYEDLQALSKTFRRKFTFPEQMISHHIIIVNPVSDDSVHAYERIFDEWKIEYRSIQIVREMAQKLEEEKDERLAKLYHFFRSSAQSSTLASSIHEHIAHRILRTDARRNLDLIQMRGDITDDAPVLVTDFEKDERSDE